MSVPNAMLTTRWLNPTGALRSMTPFTRGLGMDRSLQKKWMKLEAIRESDSGIRQDIPVSMGGRQIIFRE